jgi:hypothetical protein
MTGFDGVTVATGVNSIDVDNGEGDEAAVCCASSVPGNLPEVTTEVASARDTLGSVPVGESVVLLDLVERSVDAGPA